MMNAPTSNEVEPMDRKTSRSICDAIGERLQQYMPPENSVPPDRLQHLLDELRRRDHRGSR
jgi:hypothetical protein